MFDQIVAVTATVIDLAGVSVMACGFVIAGVIAIHELRAHRGEVYRNARQRVGKAILLGLELLVAADILRTVVDIPTLDRVAVLAAIVAIRTFLSFTLEIELTGRVPWRRTP